MSQNPIHCTCILTVARIEKPQHGEILCGNQQRGHKRQIIATKTITMEPHKAYQDFLRDHIDEIKIHGNVTNVPTKGFNTIFFCFISLHSIKLLYRCHQQN